MKAHSRVGVTVLIVVGVIVLLGLIGGGCAIGGYNRAINLKQGAEQAWSNVDSQLQRRHDLIPNLVETVKGYAAHEQGTLEAVIRARAAAVQAQGPAEKAKAEDQLNTALSRLMVVVEQYPQLRAQEGFLKLQDSLEGTENRIQFARTQYNDAVRALNSYANGFFGRFFTSWAGVKPAQYFETQEGAREAPKVQFGGNPPASRP